MFGQQLWVWGIWDLCLAALALAAGASLLGGGGFGRVIAYVWAVWVIVQSFLVIGLGALVRDRDDRARHARDLRPGIDV